MLFLIENDDVFYWKDLLLLRNGLIIPFSFEEIGLPIMLNPLGIDL